MLYATKGKAFIVAATLASVSVWAVSAFTQHRWPDPASLPPSVHYHQRERQ